MAQRATLHAQPREVNTKSDRTRLRREGKVLGVLYGHGEPQSIAVDQRELETFLRRHATGALLDLDMNGGSTVLLRQVEVDPLTGAPRHLDLQRINLRETINTTIPIVFQHAHAFDGEQAAPQVQLAEIAVHGRADQLPEHIFVDMATLNVGDVLRVQDLQIPEGLEVTTPADQVVVTISAPTVDVEMEAADAAAAEEASAASADAAAADEAAADSGDETEGGEGAAETS